MTPEYPKSSLWRASTLKKARPDLAGESVVSSQAEPPGSEFRLEEYAMAKRRMSTFERLESGRLNRGFDGAAGGVVFRVEVHYHVFSGYWRRRTRLPCWSGNSKSGAAVPFAGAAMRFPQGIMGLA
jgi:hypothetical protein